MEKARRARSSNYQQIGEYFRKGASVGVRFGITKAPDGMPIMMLTYCTKNEDGKVFSMKDPATQKLANFTLNAKTTARFLEMFEQTRKAARALET